jgi:hypothetical protein
VVSTHCCIVRFELRHISLVPVQALPCLAGTDLVAPLKTRLAHSLTVLQVDNVPGIKANVNITDVSRMPAGLAFTPRHLVDCCCCCCCWWCCFCLWYSTKIMRKKILCEPKNQTETCASQFPDVRSCVGGSQSGHDRRRLTFSRGCTFTAFLWYFLIRSTHDKEHPLIRFFKKTMRILTSTSI